jgi:hypothetical protein
MLHEMDTLSQCCAKSNAMALLFFFCSVFRHHHRQGIETFLSVDQCIFFIAVKVVREILNYLILYFLVVVNSFPHRTKHKDLILLDYIQGQ